MTQREPRASSALHMIPLQLSDRSWEVRRLYLKVAAAEAGRNLLSGGGPSMFVRVLQVGSLLLVERTLKVLDPANTCVCLTLLM